MNLTIQQTFKKCFNCAKSTVKPRYRVETTLRDKICSYCGKDIPNYHNAVNQNMQSYNERFNSGLSSHGWSSGGD